MAVMMSTFEIGWFYFVNSTVDAATLGISREIRTGQSQQSGFDKDQFFNQEVCPRLTYFGDCTERLTAQVQVFNTFSELAADNTPILCRDDDPDEVDQLEYIPGADNQIVRVRICVLYDTLNPAIGANLAQSSSGERRVTSTYIFRNEPYSKNIQRNGTT